MNMFRIAAVLLALALMIGESWRSWGVGRPIMFVLDDYLMGGFLIVAAWAVRRPTVRNRAMFAAAWGFSAGMLYPSFFAKIHEPALMQQGNWDPLVLTALVGVAFAVSLIGMAFSLLLTTTSIDRSE